VKDSHLDHHAHDEVRRIDTGHGIVVLSIFEEGIPPCFRIATDGDHKLSAQSVTVRTIRPDGAVQLFRFTDMGEYLQSVDSIPEPHEFSAKLQIGHGSHTHDYTVEFQEHAHSHAHDTHKECDHSQIPTKKSDKAIITGLLLLLTLSPCEGFLPVYLSGIQYGWGGFAFLSLTLAAATMSGMIFFTWLTLAGMKHLRLEVLEKYETGILGSLLVVLGLIVLVFEWAV
jgi:ABC-type nickel/cobalt efflux system permease component RcnA